jgi:hypothetical protein
MTYGLGKVKQTESTVYSVFNTDEVLCIMDEKLIEAEQKVAKQVEIFG